jgi:acetyl-CoA carboxylase biotin carboxyl carrier protein
MSDKKGLDLDILKDIIQILKDEDLSEICIEQNDIKIKVKQNINQAAIATQGAAIMATDAETSHLPENEIVAEELAVITAPMVGTFYRASSSDSEAYVDVGDKIKAGQVICVIDAMKLMNEITTDIDGEVVEILLEDGQAVEYDQAIFRIRQE